MIYSVKELKGLGQNQKVEFICEKCHQKTIKQVRHCETFICAKCNREKTMIERYGVSNAYSIPEIKEKSIKTLQTQEIIEKRNQTNLEKYGNICPMQDKTIQENIQQNNLKLYGVKYNFQRQDIIEKIKTTKLERYGDLQLSVKWLYEYDNTYFDSSWELAFWIYCKDKNKEIKRSRQKFLLQNGRYFYPDFEVDNNLIEIKSNFLMNRTDWKYKKECCLQNDITIISDEEIKFYLLYVKTTYSSSYLKQFKIKQSGKLKAEFPRP